MLDVPANSPTAPHDSVSGFQPTVGVVVPTLNAGKNWSACLAALATQSVQPCRRLLIDSSSVDDTIPLAQSAGFEVVTIERSEFNHGSTRQWAAEYLGDCEIIVFLTQDAILATPESVANIVACFADHAVAVAYGRQLPHIGAGAIEAHARTFNYGPRTARKDYAAAAEFGTKVFFCSNSFAAYRRSLLMSLGGFRPDLILGEDMEFAARAIKNGYANIYCASALVYHSHDYTLLQTFSRYFDIGVFDDENPWMREHFGSHSGEGRRFVESELRYLLHHDPGAIPRALLQTAAKAAGYHCGRFQRRLPVSIKRKLSMMSTYWK